MANSPAVTNPGDIIEAVITKGDLGKLSPQERTQYYAEVCRSIGVNPLTKPFEYITLNGRLQLYALRACTDQLRTLRGVSVEDMSETEREGCLVITCKVRDRDGRTDMAKGAVPIAGLKGEALANAIMKTETKAKRRATLSICGLGMLDESELETIPAASIAPAPIVAKEPPSPPPLPKTRAPAKYAGQQPLPPSPEPAQGPVYNPETGEVGPHYIALPGVEGGGKDYLTWGRTLITALANAQTLAEAEEWISQNEETITAAEAMMVGKSVQGAIAKARARLSEPPADFMAAK